MNRLGKYILVLTASGTIIFAVLMVLYVFAQGDPTGPRFYFAKRSVTYWYVAALTLLMVGYLAQRLKSRLFAIILCCIFWVGLSLWVAKSPGFNLYSPIAWGTPSVSDFLIEIFVSLLFPVLLGAVLSTRSKCKLFQIFPK